MRFTGSRKNLLKYLAALSLFGAAPMVYGAYCDCTWNVAGPAVKAHLEAGCGSDSQGPYVCTQSTTADGASMSTLDAHCYAASGGGGGTAATVPGVVGLWVESGCTAHY